MYTCVRTLAQQKARRDHHKKAKGWRYIVNLGRSPSTAIRGDTLNYSRDKLLIHLLTSYKLQFYLLFTDRNGFIGKKVLVGTLNVLFICLDKPIFYIIILLPSLIYLGY